MRLKFLESKFLVYTSIEECPSLVQKALNEVGFKNIEIEKQVAPSYLLVSYSPGLVGKTLEIEFVFKRKHNGTEIHVKWPYTQEIPQNNENSDEFRKQEEERQQRAKQLIEKFKNRIGARDADKTH